MARFVTVNPVRYVSLLRAVEHDGALAESAASVEKR
jgi:hypothetical protein